MGYMRRAALVSECGDSDLSARITSNRSEGGGVESVKGGDLSDGRASRSRPGEGRTMTAKNGSSSNAAIATMTWEHGDCLSMTPVDHTFNLVIR